ncbi:MAG: beta-propeller fold lactonase family protein [Lapillicoccus sp.]
MTRLVLGGYGSALAVVDLGPEGFGPAVEVAPAEGPSFVIASADGRFVYAALEADVGQVGAWAVTEQGPWPALGRQPTGGAAPCHVALSPDGRWLVTANYTSGSVCVHPVGNDGSLGERTDLVEHSGAPGPRADRQDGPHAHQVVFVGEGLLVCDLGLDAVMGYRLRDGRLTEVARSTMPAGFGPRHLVVDGSVAYVLGELASTVTVCDVEGLVLVPGKTVSLRAPGAQGENTAAEVLVVGDQVLASNRGDDTVVVLERDGESLRRKEIVPSGGSWPRWMGFVDGAAIVANERSHAIARLRPEDDRWTVVDTLDWSSPTCCAALP